MIRLWTITATCALLTAGLDQATKIVVRQWPEGASAVWVPGLLVTAHLENPGGVLGIAADWPLTAKLAVFLVASVGVLIVTALWLRRTSRTDLLTPTALGILLGGALGNTLDRMLQGTVTDFLIVGSAVFDPLLSLLPGLQATPAFNLADAFLGLGFVLLAALVARVWWMGRGEGA